MERDDLRQVMERLEAIAALSTLFKNLWYEKIRDEVESEKVRAYLTVYEDAVPYLNQVLEFAHHSASLLADGKLDQDKYERLQMAFGHLGAALLGREVDGATDMPGLEDLESAVELTPEQEAELEADLFDAEDLRAAPGGRRDEGDELRLEGVSRAEVEALLVDPHNGTATNIDSLFESGEPASAASSQEEIDALLEETERAGEADELDDLLQDEALAETETGETDETDLIGEADFAAGEEESATDEDLGDLLESAGEGGDEQEELLDLGEVEFGEEEPAEAPAEETELDLGELELEEEEGSAEEPLDLEAEAAEDEELDLSDIELEEEKSDDGGLDLGDLLEEDDHSEIEVSDDDLSALLNGEEDEVEEEIQPPKPALRPAAPAPKTAAKPAPKAEPAPKASPPAPKATPKPAPKPAAPAPKAAAKPAPKSAPAKVDKAEADSISQDEIDALFG